MKNFLPELLSLAPLAWAFVLLWRERKKYNNLLPFVVGVVLIFLARFTDVIVEHPTIQAWRWIGVPRRSFTTVLDNAGDFFDATGILFLVVGFIQTVKFEHAEERRIEELETLLPICSNCKKYRTAENVWMPIEKYLIESGAPRLTHGICPECKAVLYGSILKGER